ncbi:hypothetical protein SNE40_019154 [Patella caerulea]|uniref:Uncharacterized protein n=1 Tax=Patella caerulea TaxID=87958 RepID=A0AAN8J7H4_PATCE
MNVFKSCFSRDKEVVEFTARSSMIISPVSGRVTEIDDPNKDVWREQYSSGDQKDKSRIPFWNSGFSACPKCGERNMDRFEERAGIRYNGETYGTEVFMCKTKDCKWSTSFKFDDANTDNWHSETAGWPRGILHFPNTYLLMWADKHKLPPTVKHQIFIQKLDGNKILKLLEENKLAETLKTNEKMVKRIKKAIDDRHGCILLH